VSGERRLIAALSLATFAAIYSLSVVAPLVTPIAAEFAVTAGTVGLVAAAYSIPGVFTGALAGPFSDRHGRRILLVGGCLLVGAATIAGAFAQDVLTLAALRAVAGVGGATILPNMMAALADHFDGERRTRVIGIVFLSNTTASLAGISVAGLLADWLGWRVSLAFAGALALAAAVAISSVPLRRPARRAVSLFGSYLEVLGDRSAAALLLSNFLGIVAWTSWITYIVVFFQRTYGVANGLASTYALVQGAGMLVGTQFGARLGSRFGQRLVLSVSMAGYGLLLLPITVLVPALPVALALSFAGSILFGLRATSNAALYTEHVPRARSTLLGLSATTVAAATVASGALGGAVLDATGFVALAAFCLVFALASGLVTMLLVSEAGSRAADRVTRDAAPAA
jgi:predicted MFS family arabinose efflux permease